jgi:hypothetical protein
VRSPEHASLFVVEKAVFLDLMEVLPALSRNLAVVLAKRLEATTLKVPRRPASSCRATCASSTSRP